MLSVEVPSKVIGLQQQKAQICFQEIQQEIEASYNGINDAIDKKFAFFELSGAQMSISPINIQFQTLEIPSKLKIFQNELIQEIRPQVKTIVSKEVQKNQQQMNDIHQKQTQQIEQKFNKLLEEKKREYDQMINMKEEEIKQTQIKQQQQQIITQNPLQNQDLNPTQKWKFSQQLTFSTTYKHSSC